MRRMNLLLFFGSFLIHFNGGTALEELLSQDVSSNSRAPEAIMKLSPLDQLSGHTKTSDSVTAKHYTPTYASSDALKSEVQRQSDWPIFPFFNPNLYFNPHYNQISSALLKSLVDQYNNDLEMIKHRQDLVLKYAECSDPNSNKCMKVNPPDGTEHIRAANNWNWGNSGPNVEYVTSEKFYSVMNSFKTSIEKLTLRQNMLYDYVQCSCTAKTECSTSIKPVLDIMFYNTGNTTGQLIQSLFVPGSGYHNPASSFFQTLASYFNQIPSGFAYNFSPLTSSFGSYQPISTSSVSSSSVSSSIPDVSSSVSSSITVPTSSAPTMAVSSTSPQTTQTMPASSSSSESPSSESQPVYSSSSSYSSTTDSGQQVSGGSVSAGDGGKPSQEQYVVSSNVENTHISSPNDGKGVSVSAIRPVRQAINLLQAGIQAGIQAPQIGLNAAQIGVQAAAIAGQQAIHTANAGIAAGLFGVHVPYL